MPDLLLLFLLVPVVTGLIGWGTNWAAVKMIFHPVRFLGIGPLGWQGILYKQSHKFASGVADMATENLISARELMERIDPDEVEALLGEVFEREAATLCAEAAGIIAPGAWDKLPEPIRAMVVAQVQMKSKAMARDLFVELSERADDLIDLNKLVYQQLSGANVGRLAEFTQKIGAKEFKFIEYYGGVFGFLIGLVQITVWSVMQVWWLMPIVGCAVGLITNWLAIQMIFRPQKPTRYLGLITYQGLFAKRQPEIAADYGLVAGEELLSPRNILAFIGEGPGGARLAMTVTETISRRIDEEWDKVKPMVPVTVSDENLAKVKGLIATRLMAAAPGLRPDIEAYLERKLDVARTVEERLASLPKNDFERILRGIFEEDEITLILVGGFLGTCVGIAQGMVVLAL